MSIETLRVIWFILIGILWAGFFFLEGFDFGVGMLLPFLGKNDKERRTIINTIGPHWDGNEVWLITAGGATFAAFPHWYATLFSGFYLALFLLLAGLIIRGVAFEFRSKDMAPTWRKLWDWCIFTGSLLPTLLFGVAFANLVIGIPINGEMTFTGNLLTLLRPYGLLGGVSLVAICLLHGINFLNRKLDGDLLEKTLKLTPKVWFSAFIIHVGWVITTVLIPSKSAELGGIAISCSIIAVILIVGSGLLIQRNRNGWAFISTGIAVLLIPVNYFLILFPRLMVSSTDPIFNLTITNASSTAYTLSVMSIVALVFIPVVLGYQIWSFWVFRKRVTSDVKNLHY